LCFTEGFIFGYKLIQKILQSIGKNTRFKNHVFLPCFADARLNQLKNSNLYLNFLQLFSKMNPLQIAIADKVDVTAITNLLNTAYRGESSKQGWTTEAAFITGDTRANAEMVLTVIEQAGSFILIYKDDGKILGCVNLQQHSNKLYLGMFAVLPQLQGAGIGKKLLYAAEKYALQLNCNAIYMSVISLRTELIDWYKRHGYIDTGQRKTFDEDGITGKHLQKLNFIIMEKQV
jgi:ribosomal protein S18 acetylase RimI-like enzyme